MKVSAKILDAMLAEAARAHPRECCGILLGEADTITAIAPAANVHASPESHFEIDPQALVDAHRNARNARSGGLQVLGDYHSHPNGLARPSATDEAMATGQRLIWAIIAAGRVTFWREGDARFAALPYEACPR
ncbi:MAG: peptidase [Altererythrobacter sp.]|nr:peptidase [Altererythrobacter sp.]